MGQASQKTVFDLTDSIGQRKLSKALFHLNNVLEYGQSPLAVLAMVARHFRILIKAKEIRGRMQQSADVAKYLGVHPFFAKQYLSQTNNFTMPELKKSFHLLSQTDRELKSSRIPDERILENLIFGLCK